MIDKKKQQPERGPKMSERVIWTDDVGRPSNVIGEDPMKLDKARIAQRRRPISIA
jgi:hypothetical protein